ncbi:MAG: signal peptidase II [Actinomycetota bacterium]|nr:signal peptidase II [Actinomycetota bacterium]
MTKRRNLFSALLLAVAVVIADQASKAAVTAEIARGEKVDVLGPLQFTLTYNDGVAFGLAGGGGIFVILLSVIALVALGVFIGSAPEKTGTWVAGGLILGGAVGNLIDRVRLGHVTDFIHVPNFPTFNLADSAITVGVVMLALTLILDGRNEPDPVDGGNEPDPVNGGNEPDPVDGGNEPDPVVEDGAGPAPEVEPAPASETGERTINE